MLFTELDDSEVPFSEAVIPISDVMYEQNPVESQTTLTDVSVLLHER
jgi:hypothetical protein